MITLIVKHLARRVSTLDGGRPVQPEVIQTQRPRSLVFVQFAVPFVIVLLGVVVHEGQEVLDHIQRVERLRKDQPVGAFRV